MFAATLALLLLARVAAADELVGARGRVSEHEHDIHLRFDRGHATMTVRRTVYNHGPQSDEAVLALDLPEAASITGLRLRGQAGWYSGRLHIDADAEEHYRELTSFDSDGVPVDRAAALLGLTRRFEPELRLFPLAGGRTRTVEYDLEMPATWSEGHWRIELPWLGLADRPASVQVEAVDPRDRLYGAYIDPWEDRPGVGRPLAQGYRVQLDPESMLSLSLRPHTTPAVTLELAADSTGRGRAFAFWRLSLGQLSQLPAHARVIVAIDVSRSLADGVAEAQRQAALAYLWHLRDPDLDVKVTLLAFDRRVRPIGERWMSVDQGIRTLRRARFTVANGSDVDLVLRRARELLASAPAGAPRRVLVLSDLATASSRRADEHRDAAASTGAVVHFARIEDRSPRLARDDEHPWSTAAAHTHGVVWVAATPGDPDHEDRAKTRESFAELVRPLRLDDLEVELDHMPVKDAPRMLHEREGSEDYVFTIRPATSITIRGRLWNAPFVRTARQDLDMSRRWSGFILASSVDLEIAEHRHLGLRSGAVGRATSYLAVEPGAAPSRAGFLDDHVVSWGLIGKGGGGGTGRPYGRARAVGFRGRIDRGAWFASELAYLWHTCGGADESVTVVLETTFDEIVDVAVHMAHPLSACLQEAAWNLWLPTGEFVDPRMRWDITF